MISSTQDILYITVAICTAVFTGFLVWIMYYLGQVSRQSNEMITDFRAAMEDLDATVQEIKGKVTESVTSLSAMSQQVGYIFKFIQQYSNRKQTKAGKKKED